MVASWVLSPISATKMVAKTAKNGCQLTIGLSPHLTANARMNILPARNRVFQMIRKVGDSTTQVFRQTSYVKLLRCSVFAFPGRLLATTRDGPFI